MGTPLPAPSTTRPARAAHFAGSDPEDELDTPAWAGLPPIAWHADAGFATAAGTSTRAARALLRDALVVAHRLPRTWARVRDAEVPAWRARRIAQEIAGAPDTVCAEIDDAVADRADRIGEIALRQVIGAAMVRLYPTQVEQASLEALERLHVMLHPETLGHTGLATMHIRAEYADLHDLDTLLTALAEHVPRVDPAARADDPLSYRRARALGILADPALAARLLTEEDDPVEGRSPDETSAHAVDPGNPSDAGAARRGSTRSRTRSRTHVVVHVAPGALDGDDPVATHDELGPLFADRVATWCGRPTTDLTVLPVVDTRAHLRQDGYQPGPRLRATVEHRDRHCLFPWCTRPARSCDQDHVVPYEQGGPTSTANLVPLCRHHHRLKTHAGYHAVVTAPGRLHWTTPHGYQYLVDGDATVDLGPRPPTTQTARPPATGDPPIPV